MTRGSGINRVTIFPVNIEAKKGDVVGSGGYSDNTEDGAHGASDECSIAGVAVAPLH